MNRQLCPHQSSASEEPLEKTASSETLGFSIDNVQHATKKKKAKEGVTTNRTKRKRTEPDPEVSDVNQHIRGMLYISDANVTCSEIDLTNGKIFENQNQL